MRQRIPSLDLKAQYALIETEVRQAIDRVLESQTFILGPEVEAFEQEIASYCGCTDAVGVSSGTDALLVSMMALGIGPGDEVITSPYTFFATVGSIARLGARPVFVDIDPATFNLDPSKLEAAFTPRTRAVIPVHLFGCMADMGPILQMCRNRGVYVIEDAAQAIGAEYRGQRAGSMGDFGCLSFYPSKNLGGMGDGGMVTTQSAELASALRLLRSHGASPKYFHTVVGGNFRLDAIQAAVLRVKLDYLERWTTARQERARNYSRLLEQSAMVERGLVLPTVAPHGRHVYNQYVVRVPRGNQVQTRMKEQGIGVEVYYPLAMHLQECFRHLGYSQGDFPESERASSEALALPMYPELGVHAQEHVVACLCDVIRGI